MQEVMHMQETAAHKTSKQAPGELLTYGGGIKRKDM